MLFAVEGGGFFSSSASGYSKGLALLLLGQRTEEKPMRVSPWNQYELVEERVDTKPLPLRKHRPSGSGGCTSFTCFGCKSKVGNVRKLESSAEASDSSDRDRVRNSDSADESDVKVFLKSSLKKSSPKCSVVVVEGDDRDETTEDVQSNIVCADRRKIQWTDACGRELAEIKEFEPSDVGASDDESENQGARRCQCVIQ